MVISCTFDADDSTLRADEYYCLSQNDNMSSRIIIKCINIPVGRVLEYYVEFCCFNTRGVLKNKYVSPKLTFNEEAGWVTCGIPNCLTQYPGYVSAQLVAYTPGDVADEITFVYKSVLRGDRLFDVAPSVNAVEMKVLEMPNVFVEIEDALDGLKNVTLRRVRFFDYDVCVKDTVCAQGRKLTAPNFTPPEGTTFVGWYCRNTGALWDFESGVAEDEDLELFADYYNSDAVIAGQIMYFQYRGKTAPAIYVSFTKSENVRFELPRASADAPVCIALSDTVKTNNVGVAADYRVPYGNDKYRVTHDGLVSAADGTLLAPKLTLSGELRLFDGATKITSGLAELPVAVLDTGDNVRSLGTGAVVGDMYQIVRVGKSVESIGLAAFNAVNLHHLIVDRMIPPAYDGLAELYAADVTLYVPEGAVERYAAHAGFGSMFADIKSIGEAGDMAIVESELQAAQDALDQYNAGK